MTHRDWTYPALVSTFLLAACSQPATPCDGGACMDAARDAPADHAPADAGPDASAAGTLRIDPSDATLTVAQGNSGTQSFHATLVHPDNTTEPVNPSHWSLADARLGAITDAGVFTANGTGAGTVEVRADYSTRDGTPLHATTTLTVRLQFTLMNNAPADAPSHFADPGMHDARAANVLYPLDNAVMPGNVPAPDVQWDQGSAVGNVGDLYRVRVEKPHVVVDGYVRNADASFAYDWLVDPVAWTAILTNDTDSPAQITVDRWDSTAMQHVAGTPLHVTLAQGRLYGAVYYTELVAGAGGHGPRLPRLARVTVDSARHDELVPFPPDNAGGVAAKTLSRDGRYLAGSLGSVEGAVFDMLADLSTNPAPTLFPVGSVFWRTAAFSPDGTHLLVEALSDVGFDTGVQMLDPLTGMSIAATGLPTVSTTDHTYSAMPAWSPDGASVALATGVGFDSSGNGLGDLALLPQTATRDTFGPLRVLHHGADLATAPEQGNADGWPSWSPDGHWIAFQHGVPDPILTTSVFSPAALYVIAPTGGAPTRLDAAMGGATATDSYSPAFAPYQTAEGAGHSYAWVVFYSTRDYGNQAAGTQGTQLPQLWVAAVRLPITAGTDPSCVPYWLPGQSITGEDVTPTWAPAACLPTGAACTALSQCCSGNCATDPDHPDQMTCQVPTSMCRARGQSCGGNGDCCAGLTCTGNVCDVPPG